MQLPSIDSNDSDISFSFNELTGAIGDSITVLPIVVAIAVLTDLSLVLMLIWFGFFQIVWGIYYGAPISIEPMKALAALILAGTITVGETLIAGLMLGLIFLVVGTTRSLMRVKKYIGSPVVRGIQFGVALVLLETGFQLGIQDLQMAGVATAVALLLIVLGYFNLSAITVFLIGLVIAFFYAGLPSITLPTVEGMFMIDWPTFSSLEAMTAQLAMTLGNSILATSVLLHDYFGKDASLDELSSSIGIMNLFSIPFGAFPMCHGSGGVAGKYTFGARTAGANIILGLGYIAAALFLVDIIVAYPVSMLGIILLIIAFQLGLTSLRRTESYFFVIFIGIFGFVVNLGIAFVAGIVMYLIFNRYK